MNFTWQKPYHYQGKKGTLGKIISSEEIEEEIKEDIKQVIIKKIEEDKEQNDKT